MKAQITIELEKKSEDTSEEWTIDQKKEFLAKAYENIHQNNRLIRERLNNNVRHTVTLFIAIIAFLLAKPAVIQEELIKTAAAAIVLIVVLSCFVVWRQFKTLKQQHAIQASIEVAMGFHSEGSYLPGKETLFPSLASPNELVKSTYYNAMFYSYVAYIFGSGSFAIYTLITTAKLSK